MTFKHSQRPAEAPAVRIGSEAQARLTEMFESHHESVWRLLCRRGLDGDLAADMVQQAYLIAAQRLDDIRAGCERAFLLETAIRLARATWRKLNRISPEGDMDLHAGTGIRADEALDRSRAVDIFDRVLATLAPDLLEAFLLFEMEHMSMREIAEMLEIPPGTVASRLRRAREAFRAESARLERALSNRRQP